MERKTTTPKTMDSTKFKGKSGQQIGEKKKGEAPKYVSTKTKGKSRRISMKGEAPEPKPK